jgi:hypothetical protein
VTHIQKPRLANSLKFGGKSYTVVGVVKDMLTNSPYETIEPAIFPWRWVPSLHYDPVESRYSGTYSPKDETVYKKYNPSSPFVYQYNEDEYSHKFDTEERIGNLAAVFNRYGHLYFLPVACSGWHLLLLNNVLRKSAFEKFSEQIFFPSGDFYPCSLSDWF